MSAKSRIGDREFGGESVQIEPLPSSPAAVIRTRAVPVGPIAIGDGGFVVLAGPCSIESLSQFESIAGFVREQGAAMLRGGIFKLRTRPASFQGLGESGYEIVRAVRELTGLPMVAEITDPRQLPALLDLVDVIQVGTRNMYNYSLLKELGAIRKPVLLKRGFSALVDEWLHAAEYVTLGGNPHVILCERGIRTFETKTRNTLDLASVAWIKRHSALPVLVDPSHGTGRPELIEPMTLAAAAAGADGVLLEVHPQPARALSDGHQAIDFEQFAGLMERLTPVLSALGRPLTSIP
ncbi:MAG TPA: 3-deoxy-7-phosphoheptulonate synthase [Thermoanaerobaculia bacterium]|nr:3-deoxy-7-phosphoheptulonate synthase [Thermoanaerobaculia bacterium]